MRRQKLSKLEWPYTLWRLDLQIGFSKTWYFLHIGWLVGWALIGVYFYSFSPIVGLISAVILFGSHVLYRRERDVALSARKVVWFYRGKAFWIHRSGRISQMHLEQILYQSALVSVLQISLAGTGQTCRWVLFRDAFVRHKDYIRFQLLLNEIKV